MTTRLHYMKGVGVPDGHHSAPATLAVDLPTSARVMLAKAFTGVKSSDAIPSRRVYEPLPAIRAELDAGGEHLDSSTPTPMWPFGVALQSRRPVVVEDCTALTDGYFNKLGEPVPKSAVVIPVFFSSENMPGAVLIIGVNLPYDEDLASFLVG